MSWTLAKGLRPIGNRVLVKLDGRASHSGAIEIPDEYRRQPETGTVIAVGAGRCDKRGVMPIIDIKPGDRVVFGKWNGEPVDPPDDDPSGEYYMMNIDPSLRIQDVYGVEDKS